MEVEKQYMLKISHKFSALENLDDSVYSKRAWENIPQNSKTSDKWRSGYFKLKQLERGFDKDCSKLLHQRKQAQYQWLRNPSQLNGNNLTKVRHETCKSFRNKEKGSGGGGGGRTEIISFKQVLRIKK
jgi:hypothetical protein